MTAGVLAGVLAGAAVLAWPQSTRWPSFLLRSGALAVRGRSRRHQSRRARRARTQAVADALLVLDGIGPALRAGLAPRTALDHLAATSPLPVGLAHRLAVAAAVPPRPADAGGWTSPVGHVWSRAARESDADELELVAAAWSLADTCGAPLADAVDLAAGLLRDAQGRQSRLDVLLAGPRATMSLLTALPLFGPVIGLLFGIDPVSLYAGSTPATVSAAVGAGLLALGRLWCQALVRWALAAGGAASGGRPGRLTSSDGSGDRGLRRPLRRT